MDPFSVALWVDLIGVITVMVLIILKSSKEKAKVLANVNDILDKYGLVAAMNTTDDTIFLLSNDKKDEKYDEDNERELINC